MSKTTTPQQRIHRKPQPETLQQWAKRYCSERSFTLEFAQKNGVELVNDAGARRAGYPPRDGIIFRAYDPITGALNNSGQIRHQHPPIFNSKPRKFSNRKGSAAEPYFASGIDWKPVFKNHKAPIVITEGPTRSIAGAAHGFYVIALRGVDCQGVGDELHPILLQVKWKGRRVAIAFDCDVGGNENVKRAELKLAANLIALGAQVSIVRIPPIKPHAGFDDLMGIDGGAKLFQQLWDNATAISGGQDAGGEPDMVRGDGIADEHVEWLWKHRIPLKMLTGISGNPGDGKTWIALSVAAQGSRGREPSSGAKCAAFSTVYLSNENLPATLKRRHKSMGGDPKKLFVLKGARNADGTPRGITLADISVIEKAMLRAKAKLLVIDPLQSYIGSKVDMNQANQTRPVLEGLGLLAERLGCAVVIIRHMAKGSTTRSILRGLGSIDISAAFRSEIHVGTAPDDAHHRAIAQAKVSDGVFPESLRFDIEGKEDHARLVWKGHSDMTAAALAAPEKVARSTQAVQAEECLLEELKDGPKLLLDLLNGSSLPGYALSRAATKLGIKRTRKGESGPWMYQLPDPSKPRKFAGKKVPRA